MITVITPFSRKENKDFYLNLLKGKANWTVLIDEDISFPDWVTVKRYEKQKDNIGNRHINRFISEGLEPETQYMVLCDDDSLEPDFFSKIPNEDVVYVSMQRTDKEQKHWVWDDWTTRQGHWEDGIDLLEAKPENLKIARVGGEQFIVKGKILKNYRYGLNPVGDGECVIKIAQEEKITYVPEARVYFNYFEDGRWKSFKRKKTVLFICDYYCASNPKMGISEWETGLWKSLESLDEYEIARFHPDKYYHTTGKHCDEALLQAIDRVKPDYVVAVIYKALGTPVTISLPTLSSINCPIISIWGDLEADEQQALCKGLEIFFWKIVATANKSVADRFGYTYLHVPRDSRIFNNPTKERDIDIVFSGSYGYGREERQEAMLHLLNNGIKLVHGGSEGGDHFTTEEYADRYKRAKLALSFSKARGMNVVNARPFEAMSCGAMLLEQESLELAKLYTPFVDYVPWIVAGVKQQSFIQPRHFGI